MIYEQVWARWANEEDNPRYENRAAALIHMRNCLIEDSNELALCGLGLANLPPVLPPLVTHLSLSGNEFSQLPINLPDRLLVLDLTYNKLEALHTQLPPHLEFLDVSGNRLRTLPPGLPDGLKFLRARHNHLETMPEQLPAALDELDIGGNRLLALPDTLPIGLRCLDASCNCLHALPQHLPPCLDELVLYRNRFTQLPEVLLTLPRLTEVDLRGNVITMPGTPLPHDWRYPRIHTSAPLFGPEQPIPLIVAAQRWSSTPGQAWNDFDRERNAAAFGDFLDRLAHMPSAQADTDFKKQVRQWLHMLTITPALRTQCFELAANATTSCNDSIALQYNQMQQTWLAHQVHTGELDADVPAVVALGRQLFRLEQLELAARNRMQAIPSADEIEVFLAYQVKLRQVLELHCGVAEMQSFAVTGLNQNDLDIAEVAIKHAENQDFRAWLLRWPAWQGVMRRLAPHLAEEVAQRLAETVADGHFELRLAVRLAADHLQGIPDAEVQVGKQVMDELQRENDEALAIAVLGRAQCDVLLAPYWQPLPEANPS